MSDVVELWEVFGAMKAGRHVVVICKSKFEAQTSAQAFYEANGNYHAFDMKNGVLHAAGKWGSGSVEFGWVETKSGRRLDDFGSAAFSINDGWNKRSWPEGSEVAVRVSGITPNEVRKSLNLGAI